MEPLLREKIKEALRRAEALGYQEHDVRRLRFLVEQSGLWQGEEFLDPQSDLQQWTMFLRRDLARMALAPYDLYSWREAIDFLCDVWGKDTSDMLVRLNGVSQGAARGWLSGKMASSSNRARTQGFAQEAYLLRYRDGFLFQEIRIWAEDPPGSSPLERWSQEAA